MAERRKYLRYNTQGSAILKLTEGPSRSINVELVDLSFLGFSVFAQEKIEAGIDVHFELTIPLWGEPIVGKGKVVYALEMERGGTKVFRMGIDFLDVDEKTIEYALGRIVTDICKKKDKIYKLLHPDYG
jgi:hypothetical protein